MIRNKDIPLTAKFKELIAESQRRLWPWIGIFFLGVILGIFEFFPQVLLAWSIPSKVRFYDQVVSSDGIAVFTVINVVISACLGAVASIMTVYWRPTAAASGIPPILDFVFDGRLKDPKVFDIQTVFVKTLGIAMVITAGVPIGREGPAIHIGAGVAYCLSHVAVQIHNLFSSSRRVNSLIFQRKMVLYGACAGFACAFRAPVGGVLYGLEEIVTHWDSADYRSNGGHLVLTTVLAVLMLVVLFTATSTYGNIDYTSIIISQYGETIDASQLFDGVDVFGFLCVAVVCGVTGGILTRLSLWVIQIRKNNLKGVSKVVDAGIVLR